MKELAFALTYAIPAALAAIGAGIVGAAAMNAARPSDHRFRGGYRRQSYVI